MTSLVCSESGLVPSTELQTTRGRQWTTSKSPRRFYRRHIFRQEDMPSCKWCVWLFKRPRLFRVLLYVQCHTTYRSLSSFSHVETPQLGLCRRSNGLVRNYSWRVVGYSYLQFGVMTLSFKCCHISAVSPVFLRFLSSRCKWSLLS